MEHIGTRSDGSYNWCDMWRPYDGKGTKTKEGQTDDGRMLLILLQLQEIISDFGGRKQDRGRWKIFVEAHMDGIIRAKQKSTHFVLKKIKNETVDV